MRKLIEVSVLTLGTILYGSCSYSNTNNSASNPTRATISFPSYNPRYPPPPDVKDPFELRQDYPETYDTSQSYPWDGINFKEEPDRYLQAVLDYCLEGNLEVDFKVRDNKVRNWYHAPWLHDDGREAGNGREYRYGLTRERASLPFEVHRKQDVELENWAIGFYNDPGGYTLRKVWLTGSVPDPTLSNFPDGTVSFKLLFTSGTVDKVPFLAGTKEWTANIYPCNPRVEPAPCPDSKKRFDRTVRLMQIDIAVKDSSAGEAGWVFGTFIYDAARTGNSVWEKMAPVGLSWGDDSTVQSKINTEGAFLNTDLKETYLNPGLIELMKKEYTDEAYMRHHGLGGRLNGPVDNPISSCVSCHARAAVTQAGEPMPQGNFQATRPTYTIEDFGKYFSPIRGGAHSIQIDSKKFYTTDYSLQISAGIRNYYKSLSNPARKNNGLAPMSHEITIDLPEVTRGEK